MKRNIMVTFLCVALMLGSILPITSNTVYAAENEWNFGYTGSVEEWTAPYSGKYKIEVYGAQGGNFATDGANGGYSMVEIPLLAGEKLYIACGQKGVTNGKGGWNGGGDATIGGSGGGATSITTTNRGELKNFSEYKNEVLAVAGGGGGSYSSALPNQLLYFLNADGTHAHEEYGDAYLYPGFGGGLYGQESIEHMFYLSQTLMHCDALQPIPKGGTQSTGYTFGLGESGASGAGGGWYGGYAGQEYYKSSAGGSGYTINTEFNNDYGYGVNSGDGKAKITYEGNIQRTIKLNTNGCGTYNGENEVTLTYTMGDTVNLDDIVLNDGYEFISWVNYNEVRYSNSFVIGKENLILKALFVAPLVITTEKDGTNSIRINMSQNDELEKYYKVLQSKDGNTWYEAALAQDYVNGGIPTRNRQYNVGTYTYIAPITGKYKIRLYGGKGGDAYTPNGNGYGGYGAYTEGDIELKKGDLLYINIGEMGANGSYSDGNGYGSTGSGGKASDIRIGDNNLSSRIMVAAGAGAGTVYVKQIRNGTNGGALTSAGVNLSGLCLFSEVSSSVVTGATQTNGGSITVYDPYYSVNGTFYGTQSYPSGSNIGQTTGGYGYYCGGGLGTLYTVNAGTGGSSYISGYSGCVPYKHASGYYFTNAKMTAGARNGNGYGYIDILSDLNVYEDHMDNVYFYDTKAPNIPSNGKYVSEGNIISITWQDNGDNGDKYFHKVESYEKETNKLLNTSNIIEEYLETGVKGFYYYIDNKPTGTATKNHTFTEDASIEVPTSMGDRYLHVAAVDGSGNISGTYTMLIPSIAKYTVNHYVQNEDESYVLIKTEEFMDTIGKTVTPDVHTQTGRDNPPAQSIVITADGKAVVNYYYDVTRFDINGSVQWNDHSNLYGTRPEDIKVTLYRDGEYFDEVIVSAANNSNKYSFPGVQKYDLETGREFIYTVEQETAYSQAALATSEDKYLTKQSGFNFLNTINNTNADKPEKPDPDNPDDKGFYVEGNIYWDDNNDSLGFRPSKVTITLYQKGEDGEYVEYDSIIVDANTENHYLFDWLPKYWYDEDGVPTKYEYKVEETFTAWYVENGVIKNAYEVHPDMPKDCDFTNDFVFPSGPIIPVNEHTNTLTVVTDTDEPVRIVLKPDELFIGPDYSVSYGEPTGDVISSLVDKTGSVLTDLPSTRYEVIVDSPEYVIDDMTLTLPENMRLEKVGDKWYLVIENQPGNAIGTLEIALVKKEKFYQDRNRINNYFACSNESFKKATEISMMSLFSVFANEEDIIIDPEENTETSDNTVLKIEYMNSDVIDLMDYEVGDMVKILDYENIIPDGMEFVGWAQDSESKDVKYLPGDTFKIEESIELYPVFEETGEAEYISENRTFEEVVIEE